MILSPLHTLIAATLAAVSAPVLSAANDPCKDNPIFSGLTLEASQRTSRDGKDYWIGFFKVTNPFAVGTMRFAGHWDSDTLTMAYPYVTLLARGIDQRWHTRNERGGTFDVPPDTLTLNGDQSGRVAIELGLADDLGRQGSEFAVEIVTKDRKACLRSKIFSRIPKVVTPDGFQPEDGEVFR